MYITYTHKDNIVILFIDTWNRGTYVCSYPVAPMYDIICNIHERRKYMQHWAP